MLGYVDIAIGENAACGGLRERLDNTAEIFGTLAGYIWQP
jgi:hypothetical protein